MFEELICSTSLGPPEGGESHNGDDDSSESDGDEPSLSQEPRAPRNPSTGGGSSQPGSAVHRPRGTQLHFRFRTKPRKLRKYFCVFSTF